MDSSAVNVELKNIQCVYNIASAKDRWGNIHHVIVFIEPITGNLFAWSTTIDGLNYEVGGTYNIKGRLYEDTRMLSHVSKLEVESKSREIEQDLKIDAEDVLFGRACCKK